MRRLRLKDSPCIKNTQVFVDARIEACINLELRTVGLTEEADPSSYFLGKVIKNFVEVKKLWDHSNHY